MTSPIASLASYALAYHSSAAPRVSPAQIERARTPEGQRRIAAEGQAWILAAARAALTDRRASMPVKLEAAVHLGFTFQAADARSINPRARTVRVTPDLANELRRGPLSARILWGDTE